MATTDREADGLDSGYLAVLGHRVLGSVSVVSGAVETLRRADGELSQKSRARLDDAIDRHIAVIVDVALGLVRGDDEGV